MVVEDPFEVEMPHLQQKSMAILHSTLPLDGGGIFKVLLSNAWPKALAVKILLS